MNLLVVSEFSAFLVGGAEHSLWGEILSNQDQYGRITVLSSESVVYQRAPFARLNLPFNIFYIGNRVKFLQKIFPYLFAQITFFFSCRKVIRLIKESDIIVTQNRWFPYICFLAQVFVGNDRPIKIFIYIRDEKCLGVRRCYEGWFICSLKYIKRSIELPCIKIHDWMLRRSLSENMVIFNSRAMYKLALERSLFIDKYQIKYPKVDSLDTEDIYRVVDELGGIYAELKQMRNENAVLIGDDPVKGVKVFERLAMRFPNNKFLIFSKNVQRPVITANVIRLPWTSVQGLPYALGHVLIVPSRWYEAFGRVAVEAQQFGNSVLVSNQGGLLEAVETYPLGRVCTSFQEFESELVSIWNY